jgi:hypothetical protein
MADDPRPESSVSIIVPPDLIDALAAVVVEARYSALYKLRHADGGWLADQLARRARRRLKRQTVKAKPLRVRPTPAIAISAPTVSPPPRAPALRLGFDENSHRYQYGARQERRCAAGTGGRSCSPFPSSSERDSPERHRPEPAVAQPLSIRRGKSQRRLG